MPGQHGKGDVNDTAGRSDITSTSVQPKSGAYVAWNGQDKATRGKSGDIWVDKNRKALGRTKSFSSTPDPLTNHICQASF